MGIQDMIIVLGGQVLPKYSTLQRTLSPIETEKTTLGGTLFAYYRNNRREWTLTWKLLSEEDYILVHDIYIAQYNTATVPTLEIAAYGVYAPVKVEMNTQNIKHNGSAIGGLSLKLKEIYAFS